MSGKKINNRVNNQLLFAVIGICYIVMCVIAEVASHKWYNDSYDWMYVFRSMKYLIVGLVLYVFPYEFILKTISELLDTLKKNTKVVIMLISYLFICKLVSVYINLDLFIRKDDLVALSLSILSTVILIKANNLIENKWMAAGFSVLLIIINGYVVNSTSDKFLLASVVIVAEIILWLTYNICIKKTQSYIIIIYMIMIGLLGLNLVDATSHNYALNCYLKGFATYSGKIVLDNWITNSDTVVPCYSDYLFTRIIATLGIIGIVAFALLFLSMSVCFIILICRLYKRSRSRGLIVFGIYLIFSGMLIYGIFQEVGVLPTSTISMMNNRINIPLFLFAFRMFNIRKVEENRVSVNEESFFQDYFETTEDIIRKLERTIKESRIKSASEYYKLNSKINQIAKHIEVIENRLDIDNNQSGEDENRVILKNIKEEFREIDSAINRISPS